MKRVISLLVLVFVFTAAVEAQTYTKKTYSFDVEKYTEVVGEITIEGKSFDLYEAKTGTKFVKATNEDGVQYPVWIGSETEDKFEGSVVYVTKKGNPCYYELNELGWPKAIYLEKS